MASSINIAKRAGCIIREIMKKGDLGIVDKGVNDPQTEADRSAQSCIIASLTHHFPDVKIIGEEGLQDMNVPKDCLITEMDEEFLKKTCPENLLDIQSDEIVIWVDPLDGTTEYTQGFVEHVTVLIGIAVNDLAIGGVIHQPYYKQPDGEIGRTVWGLKGLGTGGFTVKNPPKKQFIITTTRSHSDAIVQTTLDALEPTEVLRVGGAGYKVLQLLEGKAHAYVFASPGCKKWDTCAPEAILETTGGRLTDILGRQYEYHSEVEFPNRLGVVATASDLRHDLIIKKIPDSVKFDMTGRLMYN